MRYTLTCTYAESDRHGVFTYVLADFQGEVLWADSMIALNSRKADRTYCGHVGLRRALRAASKRADGVVNLTVQLDAGLAEAVGYELLGVSPPLYPSLKELSDRALRRFDGHKFAQVTTDYDAGMSKAEAAVLDDAEDLIDRLKTISGRLDLLTWRVFAPSKIIK